MNLSALSHYRALSRYRTLSRYRAFSRFVPLILMVAILLLASAARFHLIGAQSLWNDEGTTYGMAIRSLPDIARSIATDVHVPLYFWGVHIWMVLAGESELALRMFSALFSVLSIAFAYALGKRLYGPSAGMATAAFIALNTFSIYYAQETRMYAMLAAVAVAGMWAFVGFVQRPNRNRALALALVNTVGLYTHYSYPLMMVTQGVLAVLWLGATLIETAREQNFRAGLRQVMPPFGQYVALNLLTLALYVPWLLTGGITNVLIRPNLSHIVSLDQILRTLEGWFAFGLTFEGTIGGMGVAVSLLLLFGLLVLPTERRRGHAWWLMLVPVVWVVVSCGLFLMLELYRYLRFLLPIQIGFALWMGRGVWVLWQVQTRERTAPVKYLPKFTAVFVVAALMASMANGLDPLYRAPEFQRDDYRSIAQVIREQAQPDDAIIIDAPGQVDVFRYYYREDTPVYILPTSYDDAQTRIETQDIIARHRRIFALLWGTVEQDPNSVVERTLADEAFQISDEWVGNVRFVRYATAAALPEVRESGARFGDHIVLQQYALSAVSVHPGDTLLVRLQWTADASLTARYKVFLQLLDSDGALVTQHDSEPGSGLRLTSDWTPGETVVDNHALSIPPDLSPGTYTLIVGLYALNDPSARLPVNGDTFLTLASITLNQ